MRYSQAFFLLLAPTFFYGPISFSQQNKMVVNQSVILSAQTLDQLYKMAKANTAFGKNLSRDVEIAYREKRQAVAEVLPSLSATSSSTWRDQANVGAFGESYQHSGYLTLSQPLFQGGALFAGYKIAKRIPKVANEKKKLEEIQFYTGLANIFYTALRYQEEKMALEGQEKLLGTRVKTLRQRVNIGRSRKTDLLAARSRKSQVSAELVNLESSLIKVKQDLANMVGAEEIGSLKGERLEGLQADPAWEKGLMESPAIKMSHFLVETAEQNVNVARSEFLPQVDLDSNYYLDRAGILAESKWDVTVQATWNLFSSGSDKAEYDIKKIRLQKLNSEFTDQKRNLKRTYAAGLRQFAIQKKSIESLETAVQLAKKNYETHVRDANKGLVSSLDVLNALETYWQSERSLIQKTFEAKMQWYHLKAMAGVTP